MIRIITDEKRDLFYVLDNDDNPYPVHNVTPSHYATLPNRRGRPRAWQIAYDQPENSELLEIFPYSYRDSNGGVFVTPPRQYRNPPWFFEEQDDGRMALVWYKKGCVMPTGGYPYSGRWYFPDWSQREPNRRHAKSMIHFSTMREVWRLKHLPENKRGGVIAYFVRHVQPEQQSLIRLAFVDGYHMPHLQIEYRGNWVSQLLSLTNVEDFLECETDHAYRLTVSNLRRQGLYVE